MCYLPRQVGNSPKRMRTKVAKLRISGKVSMVLGSTNTIHTIRTSQNNTPGKEQKYKSKKLLQYNAE